MMKWCLMSSDVGWHIRDKLWPMPKRMVQYSFTSTETRRLVRTDSPGRPHRLSRSSSWIMSLRAWTYVNYTNYHHWQQVASHVCDSAVSPRERIVVIIYYNPRAGWHGWVYSPIMYYYLFSVKCCQAYAVLIIITIISKAQNLFFKTQRFTKNMMGGVGSW